MRPPSARERGLERALDVVGLEPARSCLVHQPPQLGHVRLAQVRGRERLRVEQLRDSVADAVVDHLVHLRPPCRVVAVPDRLDQQLPQRGAGEAAPSTSNTLPP